MQDSEADVVCPSISEEASQCEYLPVTIDENLFFFSEVEQIKVKLAVGIKTIEIYQHRFPTTDFLKLFHAHIFGTFIFAAVYLAVVTILIVTVDVRFKIFFFFVPVSRAHSI